MAVVPGSIAEIFSITQNEDMKFTFNFLGVHESQCEQHAKTVSTFFLFRNNLQSEENSLSLLIPFLQNFY